MGVYLSSKGMHNDAGRHRQTAGNRHLDDQTAAALVRYVCFQHLTQVFECMAYKDGAVVMQIGGFHERVAVSVGGSNRMQHRHGKKRELPLPGLA